MDYLQESGSAIHRRRRRRRAVFTLTGVTLLLVATFGYSTAYVQGWVGTTPGPAVSATCQPSTSGQPITPRVVQINVYNATDREGLASSVAESLQSQGFRVETVGNDPLGRTVQGVGEIRRGPTGAPHAAFAATRLPEARIVGDKRTDETVDVVLGNKFTALSAGPKRESTKRVKPKPSC